jgi:hypothetical protein
MFSNAFTPFHNCSLWNSCVCAQVQKRSKGLRSAVFVPRTLRRTRISCYAASDRIAYAAFFTESRMKLDNAINLDRKSGGRGAPVQTFNPRREDRPLLAQLPLLPSVQWVRPSPDRFNFEGGDTAYTKRKAPDASGAFPSNSSWSLSDVPHQPLAQLLGDAILQHARLSHGHFGEIDRCRSGYRYQNPYQQRHQQSGDRRSL